MLPAAQPTLLGEFRIEAELGRGGSGVVYDATWGPRRVALKVLHPQLVGTGKERAQFLTEAQRLQQIAHPSVVKVLAVGQLPDGRPYLAMERLDGETLASVIARGALPRERALGLFSELCGAVAALHDQGLVHRDLKPENVFIVAGRHAVLLDFGIAKDLAAPASTTTQEGNVRGTPAYMAPERFFGQPAGIATDVYELAVVLYAMLAGRLPWDELGDPEARLSPRSLVQLDPPPPGVTEALDIEIRRALSTRAQNRPASVAALLAAVRQAVHADADAEPAPGETARMRPDETADAAPIPSPGGERPRPPGVSEQSTPLAWAPTEAVQPTAARRVRARWPYLAAAAGVAVAAAGVAWWQLHAAAPGTGAPHAALGTAGSAGASAAADGAPPGEQGAVAGTTPGSASATVAVSADDPWAPHPEATAKALPLTEGQLTPETYRAEAAAAIARLPADTRVVMTVQVDELRAQAQLAELLSRLGKHPKLALLEVGLPPCVKSIVADSEWLAFGATSLAASADGTLVVRGRWKRADVESCLADTVEPHVAADGRKLFRIGDHGWLDFVDDHTAYVTMRADLDAEKVHRLVRHGAGPARHAREILQRLPADRSIALVIDGHARDDWSGLLAIPTGSDVYGWFRVEPANLVLDLAADPHTEAAAKQAVAAFKPQIDDLFSSARADAVGKLEVVRERTVVHLRGNMTSLMLGMVTSSLAP